MPVTFNIRHLEQKNLELEGTLSSEELGLEAGVRVVTFTPSKLRRR